MIQQLNEIEQDLLYARYDCALQKIRELKASTSEHSSASAELSGTLVDATPPTGISFGSYCECYACQRLRKSLVDADMNMR